MFLLKKKPFSYKSIDLYEKNKKIDNNFFTDFNNTKNYPETAVNFKMGRFLANNNSYMNKNRNNLFLLKNYNVDVTYQTILNHFDNSQQ